MTAIAITRNEFTAAELRTAAGREKDARAGRRMLALALALDGADRTTAAATCGMDRQTLRDWVHATMPRGWRAWRTGKRRRGRAGSRPHRWPAIVACATDVAGFLPVEIVDPVRSADAALAVDPKEDLGPGRIEIDIAGGHRLRIVGAYDPDALARLIRGLSP